MRRWNRVRLGLCLPGLALLTLVGCAGQYRGDGGYGGYDGGLYAYPSWGYANRHHTYPYGWYGNRSYAYPYGGYERDWRGRRDRDDRKRHARDGWKERRYERLMDNGRPGDGRRFNERLCNNGIPGDAPAGC
jgi:hypothetical protein